MRINLKSPEVTLNGATVEIFQVITAAAQVWRQHGVECLTVTSVFDGKHKTGSKHDTGQAIDLRTTSLPDEDAMAEQLRLALGPDYDVILELDHLHVEYDPKS
jgi:D-alanyl-D-alanine dipeptidase